MDRIEAVYILDRESGSLLFEYECGARRPDDGPSPAEVYATAYAAAASNGEWVVEEGGLFIFRYAVGELMLLVTSARDAQPLFMVEFMRRLVDVLKVYLGAPVTTPSSPVPSKATIEASKPLIALLLLEMLDAGYTVTTEPNQLQDIVATQPTSLMNKLLSSADALATPLAPQTPGALSAIPWRRANVKHATSEFYVDMVEHVDVIMTATRNRIVRALATGTITCSAQLSGVPELALSIQPASQLRRLSCHPCVRAKSRPGNLSFIPPEGRFQLATYQVDLGSDHVMPLRVSCTNIASDGRFEVRVESVRQRLDNCVLSIPMPRVITSLDVSPSAGEYVVIPPPAKADSAVGNTLQWTIRRLAPEARQVVLKCIATQTMSPSHTTAMRQPPPPRLENLGLRCTVVAAGPTAPVKLPTGLHVDSLKITTALDTKAYRGVKYAVVYDTTVRFPVSVA